MPAGSTARSKNVKTATKQVSLPSAVRSYSTLYFDKSGWSKQKKLVEAFVDALSTTALWEHLPSLSVGGAAGKPRGSVSAVKTAFMSGRNEYSLLRGGDTATSKSTTAYVTIEYGAAGVQITTGVQGTDVEMLGQIALDDFFTMLCAVHDRLKAHAHVVRATAWTDWNENTPEPELRCKWPLRAIADVAEPDRPKTDGDKFWEAGHTIANAKPPARVTRTTHGGLVMLRWVDDPTDAAAADAVAVKHEAWVKTLLETTPA